jgi:hypothetical protein
MSALIIYDGAGPLPQKATFNAPLDGPAVFVLTGTATTQGNAPCLTGISLSLDGAQIGSSALCWANQNNNHTAMRTTFIDIDDLTSGEHTIEIDNANSETTTDVNDYFQVVLLY